MLLDFDQDIRSQNVLLLTMQIVKSLDVTFRCKDIVTRARDPFFWIDDE